MIIISQDKKGFSNSKNVSSFYINNWRDGNVFILSNEEGYREFSLGEYDKDENAICVLYDLLDHLQNNCEVYCMPESDFFDLDIYATYYNKCYGTKIDDLNLPAGTTNALKRHGIRIVEQLMDKTESELLDFHGIGKVGLEKIKRALKENGFLKPNLTSEG